MRLFRLACLTLAFTLTDMLPVSVSAQSDLSNQNTEDLRKQMESLREQMNKLQARIDQMESSSKPAATTTPSSAPTAQQPAVPSTQGTIETGQAPAQVAPSKSAQVGQATATYDQFSEDTVAAPRFDNIPLDPKYQGFFALPGTQDILKIGGYFKTDFIHDLKPAGNVDAFVPSSFPVPQVSGVYNSNVSVRPTRLSLDFRIPSTRIGEVRFYVEGDLFGPTPLPPGCVMPTPKRKTFWLDRRSQTSWIQTHSLTRWISRGPMEWSAYEIHSCAMDLP